MKLAITRLVQGEKNGKPWYRVDAIVPRTGEVMTKFTTAEVFGKLEANTTPVEGFEETDLEFDSRGNVVGVQ